MVVIAAMNTMANFRLLGNTLIDFSQVRSVEATETGFEVTFTNSGFKWFACKDAAQVLEEFYAETERVDDERLPLRAIQTDEAVQ